MFSKRKPYYHLKRSVKEFFEAPVRYLKELSRKESLFEKPYLDESYPEMHLDLPFPRWPRMKPPKGADPVGVGDPEGIHTVIWSPGYCTISTANPECGDTFTVNVRFNQLPPHIGGFGIKAEVKTKGDITLVKQEQRSPFWAELKLTFVAGKEFDGTAEICVKATLSGSFVRAEYYKSPKKGVFFPYAESPADDPKNHFVLESQIGTGGIKFDCDCRMIPVSCDTCEGVSTAPVWVANDNPATIAGGGSGTASLIITGNGSPSYTWAVEGTGFSLAAAVTTGLTNTLMADATACGRAKITVTGCTFSCVGYIRCTTGEWVSDGDTTPQACTPAATVACSGDNFHSPVAKWGNGAGTQHYKERIGSTCAAAYEVTSSILGETINLASCDDYDVAGTESLWLGIDEYDSPRCRHCLNPWYLCGAETLYVWRCAP